MIFCAASERPFFSCRCVGAMGIDGSPRAERARRTVSYRGLRIYEECFEQVELTLALAVTETLMLAVALADAVAAVPAHAMALPPRLLALATTAWPVADTFSSARTASGPFALAAAMSLGRLASRVALSLVMSPVASALQKSVTDGGVQ